MADSAVDQAMVKAMNEIAPALGKQTIVLNHSDVII
jgi:hypothetical protein